MSATRAFRFDNTYARELPGTCVACSPAAVPEPRLLFLNHELAEELGVPGQSLRGPEGAAVFAGNALPEGSQPVAQAYAGHQFGGFSPQLGDGRALLLGEVIDRHGRRRDIALKGSGRTPFSRGGDGKAALGPMLREALIGEAMQALGIPSTRALAVAATGEMVWRNRPLPGAVLARVAASHLRVGSLQYFAARGDLANLARLADYAIARHDPQLAGESGRPLGLLRAVVARQARLLAQWMNVGFIHGVMNTDNMTLSGETIDYGPCAFMEAFDPEAVFSSIDHGGRYAWGRQPEIAQWNLARLAEALLPLMAPADDDAALRRAVEEATEAVEAFGPSYGQALLAGQRAKLGLQRADPALDEADRALAEDWLALMQAQRADFTLGWRRLADAAAGDEAPLKTLLAEPMAADAWLARWRARCALESPGQPAASQERAERMRRASPWIVPRNHRVEEALAAAEGGDLQPFEQLLEALRQPWRERAQHARYAEPAPVGFTERYQTFCGT